MLKRKIEDVLLRWKQTPERKPLVSRVAGSVERLFQC